MMPLFWVVLWLPPLFSAADHCAIHESSSSQNTSPLLQSLQCHNDYQTYVHCRWRKHGNTTLQLWFKTENKGELCVSYSQPDEHGNVQCRYNTSAFSMGMKHTVYFVENETLACSSVPHQSLNLSQQLRARPPTGLSTREADDGGRWLSWSSPYSSSSSLNKNLTYQLSYRADTQGNWNTVDVTKTSMRLEKQLRRHRYEAKVRARASVGQWSVWSPVVTWTSEDDSGQIPSLNCVLDGEREVMCSWEMSRELAHFITYQLACRHNQTAPSERCCMKPTVSSDPSGTLLMYSCSLTVSDPAHLLLELLPTHNAKTFTAYQHIRPNPPQKVTLREKDKNWIVEWEKPKTDSKPKLYYQVCYYKTQEKRCSLLNISGGSRHLFPAASLEPSQQYQVKVRSLIIPGEGFQYEGIPSEWTDPVAWTSHEATWSFTSLVYVLICVFVVTVFFTLYCTIPACRRRVIVWVDSVPSPGKSKILSEIKSATNWTIIQKEDKSLCKDLHYDTISTCSLWPTTDTEKMCLESSEEFWTGDNFPSSAEKISSPDTSSMSFSGPYIFCQRSESICKSGDVMCEEKEKEEKNVSKDSPSPVNFALFGEGYVRLPKCTISRSTQDLVSHSTNTHKNDSTEHDQQSPNTTLGPDKTDVQPGLIEASSRDQPPPYTSGPFIPWPQGGIIHASGYCHLPQP